MKFNKEQIELIQDVLFNQKLIWSEDKEHYKSEIELIEECRNIIDRNIIDNELKTNKPIKQS